ncbi:MAG TPA: hypothetical protein VFW75_01325, partial [Acetobacteraceae bacterium]|nr:hypothetical protein [Acetobacteraceae bacterium]
MKVEEIIRGAQDAAGAPIEDVYMRQPPHYAIYRTPQRVMVHFADADDEARQQAAALVPLNPVRGQINGLIDGWRSKPRNQSRAWRYDRRVADALGAALEGDPKGALDLMNAIKADITDERTSWARFQYLIAASALSVVLILVVWAVKSWTAPADVAGMLWLALAGGSIGAFFSVAIGIRSRTVLTDLHLLDNAADAVLRIFIGAIAGGVLVGFVRLNAVSIKLGNTTLDATTADAWLLALALAFIAGFSERLIPDLLAKSAIGAPIPVPAPQPQPQTQAQRAAAGIGGAPAPAAEATSADPDANRLADCLCDHGIEVHEITQDA